MVVFRVLVWIS